MYAEWKEGELEYLCDLLGNRGDENVPRAAVESYLRAQAWAASDDPTLLHVHRFPLAATLATAAYLVGSAEALPSVPANHEKREGRWFEARVQLVKLLTSSNCGA